MYLHSQTPGYITALTQQTRQTDRGECKLVTFHFCSPGVTTNVRDNLSAYFLHKDPDELKIQPMFVAYSRYWTDVYVDANMGVAK